MNQDEADGDGHVLWVGFVVEGGLIALAFVLSMFGFYDHQQRLDKIEPARLWQALYWGSLSTLPMLGYLAVFHFFPNGWLQPMREFCEKRLQPIFRSSTLFELALLSLLAGFGEELLFRWCLQGGMTSLLIHHVEPMMATAIGLIVSSILFGMCHWVNASYGLTTMAIGLFLGLTMIWTGDFLVPAVAHSLYDFIALIYITRMGIHDSTD